MKKRMRKIQVANQTRKTGGEAGFTIMETAIALVLMAIVGLGAASLFFYAARNTVSENDRQLAMAVAQQQLEQLRNVDFLDPSLNANAGTTTTVTRASRQYSVFTRIVNSNVINGLPTTKTITIRVTPVAGNTPANMLTVFAAVTLVTQRTALTVGPNRAI